MTIMIATLILHDTVLPNLLIPVRSWRPVEGDNHDCYIDNNLTLSHTIFALFCLELEVQRQVAVMIVVLISHKLLVCARHQRCGDR